MGCPACARTGTVHEDVPVYTQYMSPGLIETIAYGGVDPADDPQWRLSGARTRQEYGRWCRHACGMACLQMVLHHRDGNAKPLLELLHQCRAYGGYVDDGDGNVKGLIYAPFAAYVRAEHGLDAQVHPRLALDDLGVLLADGWLIMASVHKEIRRPDRPAPGAGGHLVLVTGHTGDTVHLANPSGHTPQSRSAQLPRRVFASFFGGRGIAVRV